MLGEFTLVLKKEKCRVNRVITYNILNKHMYSLNHPVFALLTIEKLFRGVTELKACQCRVHRHGLITSHRYVNNANRE